MSRLYLAFLIVFACACSVVAEEGNRPYSLKIMFQKVGEEAVSTLEFPNLDLEQNFQVTGPFPGVEGLVIDCKPDVYDTPMIGFEVYDPKESIVSNEGRTITSNRIEATCPIVYGKEMVVVRSDLGTLSFALDGPGPKARPAKTVKPKAAEEGGTVERKVLDQIVFDSTTYGNERFSLRLYNPTKVGVQITRVLVADADRSFERSFAVAIKLKPFATLEEQFTGFLPEAFLEGKSFPYEVVVEIETAELLD